MWINNALVKKSQTSLSRPWNEEIAECRRKDGDIDPRPCVFPSARLQKEMPIRMLKANSSRYLRFINEQYVLTVARRWPAVFSRPAEVHVCPPVAQHMAPLAAPVRPCCCGRAAQRRPESCTALDHFSAAVCPGRSSQSLEMRIGKYERKKTWRSFLTSWLAPYWENIQIQRRSFWQ